MLVARHFLLAREKMLRFLDTLEEADDEGRSLYLPSGLPPTECEELLGQVLDLEPAPPDLARLVLRSATGIVLFWGRSHRLLVAPPFPISQRHLTEGYDVEPLRSLLRQDLRVALVLVRLGAYAIGVGQGEELITSKVGTGLVHARHKKGGSSQARFERHRAKQIEYFLGRVCQHAREQLEPYTRALDYITYGGARLTIISLRKHCSFLRQFDSLELPPLLNIPEPRQAVLEGAIRRTWSSRLTEWQENQTGQDLQ